MSRQRSTVTAMMAICLCIAAHDPCDDLTPMLCGFEQVEQWHEKGVLVAGRACSGTCVEMTFLVDTGWHASDCALSRAARLQLELESQRMEEDVERPSDATGTSLTMFHPNVQLTTFFNDTLGRKIGFQSMGRSVSDMGHLESNLVDVAFGILGLNSIVKMGLTIVADGEGLGVVRKCPLSLSQRLSPVSASRA